MNRINTLHLLVFAKAPEPNRVKTRLIPSIGVEKATKLAHSLLNHTLELIEQFQTQLLSENKSLQVHLAVAPRLNTPFWQKIQTTTGFSLLQQPDGDLGNRLKTLINRVRQPGDAAIAIGTDCPYLTIDHLSAAVKALEANDCVVQGAKDGGYVLLGLNTSADFLFDKMPWSSDQLLLQTLAALEASQLHYEQLWPSLSDIDRIEDLNRMNQQLEIDYA